MLAKNTQLLIGDGEVSEGFDQILGVTEVDHDGTSWDTEDITNHDDTTPVRQMVTTIRSNGSINVTFPYNATNTQHALLRSLSRSGAARNYQLLHVDDAEHVGFEGYVSKFKLVTPVDGVLKCNATILVNGDMADVE